jgi:hypothetical protein
MNFGRLDTATPAGQECFNIKALYRRLMKKLFSDYLDFVFKWMQCWAYFVQDAA